ncbi:conjugal transfer pilus assembly protein TrbC [Rickettsia tamurae subsp. buchneri]|uniref:Conjugal transfer pilus assembly protein TrbC n=2 Tax=Rickettsia TaxID=780 RepID=A0A8E0WMA1_9RICK|nr:type-F conjugative transfer system pilin assembly protein TrbC [Rickettsia endosymbiont of Ixodes scapularis]KDO03240.1 conjugal transfer pilus assembly protein TrbC [Rickettsia tamurae subsp. buchneri]
MLTSLLVLSSTSNANILAKQENLLKNTLQSQIYIFVSFSMPDSTLKNYFIEAEKISAKLIMRGLKNNAFVKSKAKADEIGISFNIDPELFEKYQITAVPVIVIDNNQGKIKKLAGHIALNDALQIMQEEQM